MMADLNVPPQGTRPWLIIALIGIGAVLALLGLLIYFTPLGSFLRTSLTTSETQPSPQLVYQPDDVTAQGAQFADNRLIIKFKPDVPVAAGSEQEAVSPLSPELLVTTLPGVSVISARNVFSPAPPLLEVPEGPESEDTLLQTRAERREIASSEAGARGLERVFRLEVRDSQGRTMPDLAAQFSRLPEVEYAEPDFIAHTALTGSDPFLNSQNSWGQGYADLWGLDKIEAERAWDVSQGAGIVVAVVDTGVAYTHPDLQPNIWVNVQEVPGNGVDDDSNGLIDDYRGWNFYNFTNDPMDVRGHGTHVAGTIAAALNNGRGVAGVAPQVKIMALKAFPDFGGAYISDLAWANQYATDMGAHIINNSWSGAGSSQMITDVMAYAEALGVVVVASAGNNIQDVANYLPGNIESVVAVASTTQADTKSSFSNYGSGIDVSAPGGEAYDIVSTMLDNSLDLQAYDYLRVPEPGTGAGHYWRISGTSMAAPHVSGVAALILAKHPEMTVEEVRTKLRESTNPITASVPMGTGRVNAFKAVAPAQFSDTFDRADSTNLGAVWQEIEGDMRIASGKAVASVLSTAISNTFSARDVSIQADVRVRTKKNAKQSGVIARVQPNGDMYAALVTGNKEGVYRVLIQVRRNGTWTTLTSKQLSGSLAKPSGVLKFDVFGSTLSVVYRGKQVVSITDTSISSAGKVGVRSFRGTVDALGANGL